MAKRNNSFSKDRGRARRHVRAPREPRSIPTKAIVITLIAILAVALIVATVFAISAKVEENNEVLSIHINTIPTNQYYVGDKPDYSGLVLGVTRRNGDVDYVSYESDPANFRFTGFDSTAPVQGQSVTVFYQGFGAKYYVNVNEVPQPAPTLSAVELETIPKTEYTLGDILSTKNGMLIRTYSDGSTKYITLVNNYVYGFKAAMSQAAMQQQRTCEYTLTVKYVENGILAETTYKINITNPDIAE